MSEIAKEITVTGKFYAIYRYDRYDIEEIASRSLVIKKLMKNYGLDYDKAIYCENRKNEITAIKAAQLMQFCMFTEIKLMNGSLNHLLQEIGFDYFKLHLHFLMAL